MSRSDTGASHPDRRAASASVLVIQTHQVTEDCSWVSVSNRPGRRTLLAYSRKGRSLDRSCAVRSMKGPGSRRKGSASRTRSRSVFSSFRESPGADASM